ncbi:MAG: hypothetical protein ACD_60C00079G0025 [uncultured bacterium]|nr:MAG: hypothetical protein ACD_60C00079G0025 [uncultured bacterium]
MEKIISKAGNFLVYQDGRLLISGDLNFLTVMSIWQQSLPWLVKLNELHFDLTRVHSSNSAGLALLLQWLKFAKKSNKPIQFTEVPAQLGTIIKAAGLQKMFFI